eukprot:6221189-Prymnesium_polylepis.1
MAQGCYGPSQHPPRPPRRWRGAPVANHSGWGVLRPWDRRRACLASSTRRDGATWRAGTSRPTRLLSAPTIRALDGGATTARARSAHGVGARRHTPALAAVHTGIVGWRFRQPCSHSRGDISTDAAAVCTDQPPSGRRCHHRPRSERTALVLDATPALAAVQAPLAVSEAALPLAGGHFGRRGRCLHRSAAL